MAGNTKLLGFGANEDGPIVGLEKWGQKAIVNINQESIDALKKACYEELPIKPPPAEEPGTMEFSPDTGLIHIELDQEDAVRMRYLLDFMQYEGAEDEKTVVAEWLEELDEAIKARDAYNSNEGEPGHK